MKWLFKRGDGDWWVCGHPSVLKGKLAVYNRQPKFELGNGDWLRVGPYDTQEEAEAQRERMSGRLPGGKESP